jgi:CO/xanthine dehydrogenase Mo-binding subunit
MSAAIACAVIDAIGGCVDIPIAPEKVIEAAQ